MAEGESHNSPDFTEGCNSWHSVAGENTVEQATGYGGSAPPDKEHRYTLKVYALDTVLDLKRGFRLNELSSPCRAMFWHMPRSWGSTHPSDGS